MFLCAQARPRYDPNTKKTWDGKIGIWPIGEWVEAQRSSSKRAKGTLVWKDKKVDGDTYMDFLVEKVLPAIAAKWPRGQWNDPEFRVVIQQDGARPHATKSFEDTLLLHM